MIVSCRTWLVLAVAAAVLAGQCCPVAARNDVMIIRLEDPSAEETPVQDAPKTEKPQAEPEPKLEPETSGGSARPAAPPVLSAASAVVMDAETGQILYSKNPHVRRPNASTTKILTAILLIENRGMSHVVTASKKACETPFTSLNLRPGEQISARDLLMGLMVRSANDAAVAVAEDVGGSVSKFAAMMNRKAKEIGCKDTNFVTPNGLHANGHYSTAYDLCLIAKYAIKYPVFNEVVNTRKHILSSRTVNREDLAVFAKHKFLTNYSGADGIKSGYLKQAGCCYVGSATRDGWRLISSVLKSDSSSVDTTALMDYAFNDFKPVVVARADKACVGAGIKGGSRKEVPAAPIKDLKVVVPKAGAKVTTTCEFKSLEAPVEAGVPVGEMIAFVDGRRVAKVGLKSTEAVRVSFARRLWGWTKMCGIAVVCLMVGRKYGYSSTKGTRRRRRRVQTSLRGIDRFG